MKNLTSTVPDNLSAFDFDAARQNIEMSFNASAECAFWKARPNRKGRQSYTQFNVHKVSKKRNARHQSEFKRSKKWYGYDDRYFDYDAYRYELSGNAAANANSRRFCPCCRRTKFLFTTEEKANNFLKYNSQAIEMANGYAPKRSYYCPVCGGWHVTSHDERLSRGSVYSAIEADEADRSAVRSQVIAEICNYFDNRMQAFDAAYDSRDINTCKEVHKQLTTLFNDVEIDDAFMETLQNRLIEAHDRINSLCKQIESEDKLRRNLIFGIQRRIQERSEVFNRVLALGKISECYEIFFEIRDAITAFPHDMPFIGGIKDRLSKMEQSLASYEAQLKSAI